LNKFIGLSLKQTVEPRSILKLKYLVLPIRPYYFHCYYGLFNIHTIFPLFISTARTRVEWLGY